MLLNAQINFDGTILQIDTCDTYTLYDSGGPSGNYGNNENFTITLCPSIPNSQIKIDFLFKDSVPVIVTAISFTRLIFIKIINCRVVCLAD